MDERPNKVAGKLRSNFACGYDRAEAPPKLEEILSRVSVRDVIAFGATCSTYHQLSLSSSLWRRLCHRQATGTQQPSAAPPNDWRRTAILKYSQGLQMQRLGSGWSRTPRWCRSGGPSVSLAVVPPLALGYRRSLPTRDHLLLFDFQGTVFLLRNAATSSLRGHMTWRRAARHAVLCQNAKDFAVDPRSDTPFRQYIYNVLVEPSYPAGPARGVFRMTFHPSLTFIQLRITGSEVNQVPPSDTGKVYSLSVNETQLNTPRSYTVQLALKEISISLPHLPVAQVHSSYSSVLYLTGEGSVYLEVHSVGVYRQFIGTQQGYDPHDIHTPLPLSLPYKVPRTARSLCASKDCLFLLCCHDIAEPPLFRCPPPVKEEESEVARDERERLIWQLAQLRECESLRRKVDILRWAVQRHMTINPAHREFLVQALIAIRPVSDEPSGQS
nr:LOW QUALITY PROTEIN: F-box only protein 24 [Salvelinus alpinus]